MGSYLVLMIRGIRAKRRTAEGDTWCVTTSQQPPKGQHPSQNPYQQPQGQHGPPAGGWPPPQPAPKKRRRWPWILGGIILLIVLISAVNGGGNQPSTPVAAPVAPPVQQQPAAPVPPVQLPAVPAPQADTASSDTITYEVTGSGTATSVTYIKDKNMGQEQIASAKLPWSKQVQFDGGTFSFQPLSLVAQNGQSGGNITCKISKNGQEITSSTSSGPFAVVTCSGN